MTITYEQYRYENGEHRNESWNKGIISIARRHKFYYKRIKHLIKGDCWFGCRNHQIIVCLNTGRKLSKVVGFIVYEPNTLWNRYKERMITNVMFWCVDEKFRGKDIGKTLYEKMEADVLDLGIHNYCVEFKKSDEKLTQLYTNMGYKPIDKYDQKETKSGDTHHNKWYKVVYTRYTLPSFSMIQTNTPPEPQVLILVE
jgi:L-amino acid N-acyltransferase YncA